ncbi:MAG TPA: hypothetical protein VNJ05_11090 [Sphingomicrobium sp.]|nr:hypothetical protein [Sphingomicrobium sp.]
MNSGSGKHYFGAPAHLRREQQICDAIQAEFRAEQAAGQKRSIRRENAPPIDPALVPTDDELRIRLAEELDYARRMLDAMGDELSADMGVVMRHGVALQTVDIVGQMLGHIAAVTRSSAPERAVERIGMCELKARLTRRGGV